MQPEILWALVAITLFAFTRTSIKSTISNGPIWVVGVPLVVLLVLLIFPGPKSRDVAPASNILIRVTGTLLALYAVAAPVTFPTGVSPDVDLANSLLRPMAWAGLLVIPMIFLRPAFAIIPAVLVLSGKALATIAFEIEISRTDYMAVLESALFLGLAHCLIGKGAAERLRNLIPAFRDTDIARISTVFFIVAVAAHFSNYFYSGWQKLALDGGPFLWAFTNPTYILAHNAVITGMLPTSHFETVSQWAIAGAERSWPLINAATLIGQLAAIVCIARRRLMIAITLFYDLTHVVIFLVSGIFFWKWIIMNLALVAAMHRLPKWVEERRFIFGAILVVWMAPQAFEIVRLGWYDSQALTYSETVAVTHDGEEIVVPSNFFGSISVTAAQSRLGRVEAGHYPTVTWGTTQDSEIYRQARDGCRFEDSPWRFEATQQTVTRLIQMTHAYAVQREQRSGHYTYDLFPHHIWSNPFEYQRFASLSMGDISHYLYRTSSVCVMPDRGTRTYRLDHQDEFMVSAEIMESISGE